MKIYIPGIDTIIDTEVNPVVLIVEDEEKAQIAGMDGKFYASAPDDASEEALRGMLERAKDLAQ